MSNGYVFKLKENLSETKKYRAQLNLLSDIFEKELIGQRVLSRSVGRILEINLLLIIMLRESDEALINANLPNNLNRYHLRFRRQLMSVAKEHVDGLLKFVESIRRN